VLRPPLETTLPPADQISTAVDIDNAAPTRTTSYPPASLPALFAAHVDDVSDAVICGLGSSRLITATQLTVDTVNGVWPPFPVPFDMPVDVRWPEAPHVKRV